MENTPLGPFVSIVGAMITSLEIYDLKCIHHFATDLVDTYSKVIYNDIYTFPSTNFHYDEGGCGMLLGNEEKVK